jgi:uncharacterized protein (TIGR03437 family)
VKRGIPAFWFACTVGLAQQYVAWTVAGGGQPFTPVAAVNASLASGGSLATDASGNVYIRSSQCVLKVDTHGILTLVAGNGRAGSPQDGVPATSAHLSASGPIASDPVGNIYTVDPSIRVRKISVNGTITTVAGNGTQGSSGDGGPATSAQFNEIESLAADGAGNLYIVDASGSNRVRRVSASGIISTVAGNGTTGFSGDGGPATSASLFAPRSVATDTAGNLYIAEAGNNRIRKVSTDGIITTVAGNGVTGSTGDGGPATSASLFGPWSVAVDGAGDIYIGGQDNRVRKVSTAGIITTVAGNGTYGISGDGGQAIAAALTDNKEIAADRAGNLYIADSDTNRVRKVTPAGMITTIAGNGTAKFSGDGGPAPFAQLGFANSVAADAAGNLFIADSVNNRVRKVSIYGTITTVAGNGTAGFSGDGGPALNTQFQLLSGVAIDRAGNLYIADSGNARVRRVSTSGIVTTFAGGGTGGDGGQAASAKLLSATALAFDNAGNLFILDSLDSRVRKVSTGGIVTTVAGTGTSGYSGDGGPATSTPLLRPTAIAVDASGNLYIADGPPAIVVNPFPVGTSFIPGQPRIRKVSADGIIRTVAGNGTPGYSGDGGPATSAQLNEVDGMAVDAAGNLYIADTGNLRLRVVSPAGSITTAFGGPSPDPNAQLHADAGVAVDAAGNIYVADGDAALRLQPAGQHISLSALANAASELPGPVAPGEIVVLRGSALGPSQLTVSTPSSSGALPPQLAGTRVLFNGVAAPVIYAWEPLASAVVPYGIADGPLQVVVEYQGVQSAPLQVQVAADSPGLFTSDAGGKGQAAALNENGTFNMANASAPAGSIVSLFATGEGLTTPAGVDGKAGSSPLPRPRLNVQAVIDGQLAEVLYAGGVLGAVAGVMQVDVRVPAGTRAGSVPLSIMVGTVTSQPGVTIAVSGN